MNRETISKSEVLNSKQIHPRPSQMSGIQITKIQNLKKIIFEHLKLGFKYCLGFRILKLVFCNAIAILIVLLSIVISCANIPRNVGKSRDIVIISSKVDTNLIVKNLQVYNYVPQKEGLFMFIFAPDTAIKKLDRFHTIFLYGSLQDDFINILLNPEAKIATKKDTFNLFKLNDLWAKGQLAIILATSAPEYIEPGIIKYKDVITKILEDNFYARIKERYYETGIDKKINKTLRKYGIVFDLKKGWLIDSTYKNENFLFIHVHAPDRSIFCYKENKAVLNAKYAIDKRNELTKKYYKGDYILQDLTQVESIEFKNMKGLKLRGVWQNDSLVAGGPFLTYLLTQNDTVYIIDGMLFHPGERKSDYFTTLEVIMNSFEIINTAKEY
jgi:hypothetical protein